MRGYSYATVERMLGAVFGVPEGPLRGRIKNLQRLGLTTQTPGKGAKVVYDDDQIVRWVVALEFESFGIPPGPIVAYLKRSWDRRPGSKRPVYPLREVIAEARKSKNEQQDVFLQIKFNFLAPEERIVVGYGRRRGLATVCDWLSGGLNRRMGLFNLSERLREVDAALQGQPAAV